MPGHTRARVEVLGLTCYGSDLSTQYSTVFHAVLLLFTRWISLLGVSQYYLTVSEIDDIGTQQARKVRPRIVPKALTRFI